MMKKGTRLLLITEISTFIVVTIGMFFSIAWLEPITPIKQTFRIVLPFLLITYFFLFTTFRILGFYYIQLLNQKRTVEQLNNVFMKLSTKVKIDDLLKQSLECLMSFCHGTTGIMLIIDKRLKEYASGEVLTITINNMPENNTVVYAEKKHRMLTFFPSDIPLDINKKIQEMLLKYDFSKYRTIVTVPVASDNKIKAVAIVGVPEIHKRDFTRMCDDMKNIINIFIRELDIQIENSILLDEINKASITDPLTHLYNRRYFNKRAKEEFLKAKRIGFPVSIMISDIDSFKNYVDTYEHPKGDIILSEIASVINSNIRESDVVCRFGGDEFAYLLPFTSSVEAVPLAERIKKSVSQYVSLKNSIEEPVHLTLSIGIASFPEHGQTAQEIISKADNALFFSKKNGKNRISIYNEVGGKS